MINYPLMFKSIVFRPLDGQKVLLLLSDNRTAMPSRSCEKGFQYGFDDAVPSDFYELDEVRGWAPYREEYSYLIGKQLSTSEFTMEPFGFSSFAKLIVKFFSLIFSVVFLAYGYAAAVMSVLLPVTGVVAYFDVLPVNFMGGYFSELTSDYVLQSMLKCILVAIAFCTISLQIDCWIKYGKAIDKIYVYGK